MTWVNTEDTPARLKKIEAPRNTVDQLIEVCGEAEREANAYQEKVNAYQADL